jgi:DNA-directed RNA polymerase specialized sigma24 family protein
VCGRLIDAGVRAARKVHAGQPDRPVDAVGGSGPSVPARPADHPDFVLARAVAAGVVDADEAHLIATTRLEGATLAEAGQRLGLSVRLASAWRAQAEQRLREAIRDGELAFVTLRSRRGVIRPV